MAEKPLREKVRNAFAYREDHHAQLARFLQRGHLPARLAQFRFQCDLQDDPAIPLCHPAAGKSPGESVPQNPARAPAPSSRKWASRSACITAWPGGSRQLRRLGWNPVLRDWRDQEGAREALQLADCVLFYRIPMAEHGPDLYAEARRLGLPILYDIDDLIFHKAALAAHISRLCLRDEHAAVMLNAADAYLRAMEASERPAG